MRRRSSSIVCSRPCRSSVMASSCWRRWASASRTTPSVTWRETAASSSTLLAASDSHGMNLCSTSSTTGSTKAERATIVPRTTCCIESRVFFATVLAAIFLATSTSRDRRSRSCSRRRCFSAAKRASRASSRCNSATSTLRICSKRTCCRSMAFSSSSLTTSMTA